MIEGQPADKAVLRAYADRRPHDADIGQQLGMGEGDALGITGAAGGVLYEGDITACDRLRRQGFDALREFVGGHYRPESRHLGPQQRAHLERLGHGDQQHTAGIVENPPMAAQVFIQLREAHRRIDGHRNGPQHQDGEKTPQIRHPGGQHDGDGIPALHAPRGQPRGDRLGLLIEGPIVDGGLTVALL